MFCPQCGKPIESHFRFCGSCGAALARAGAPNAPGPRMELHFKVLGWILIGLGILIAMVCTVIFLAAGIVERVPLELPPDLGVDGSVMASSIMALVALVIAVVAALAVAAGVGVLSYQAWGRVLALIVAAFLLFQFPLGTAIGVYAFWTLLSSEGRQHFRMRVAEAA